MPGFQSIIDQEKPLRQLFRILQTGKIPHAQLFTGIEGVGKKEAALKFAMACNCRKGQVTSGSPPLVDGSANLKFTAELPCGECKPCRKITSRNHPDIISVQAQKNQIRVAQIRELHRLLAMKPYEAKHRFVIIADAQNMNLEAANSLLKILEEPPPQTYLILTAYHLHDLLPTIASRCQHVRFHPISKKALVDFLRKQGGLSDQDAGLLANLAKGSLGKARQLATSGWIKRRAWILNILTADSVRTQTASPLTTLLAFSEKLAQSKAHLVDALEIMQTWFRDLMVFPSSPDKIINQDRTHDLERVTQQLDMNQTLSIYDTIQKALERIDGNANPRLVLDLMFIHFLGLNHEKDRRYPV